MATSSAVVNPLSAYKTVSDYRTHVDDGGEPVGLGSTISQFLAGGTVAVGDVVALVPATSATVPTKVIRKVTARKFTSVVGVVRDIGGAGTGIDGDVVSVVTAGLALVNVGSGTPAAGDNATIQGNSHEALAVATEADATTIAGTVLGTFLGAKNASNRAPVFISPPR